MRQRSGFLREHQARAREFRHIAASAANSGCRLSLKCANRIKRYMVLQYKQSLSGLLPGQIMAEKEHKRMANRAEPSLRNISDTALWVAVHRARETERPNALFRDPFARKLAGERGERIAREMHAGVPYEWPYIARTVRFDQIVSDQVTQGADMVINLAAGLDTRPYRMELPASLKWVEVDLPGMIDYKEEVLSSEKPQCALERVRLDLTDLTARRALFQRLGSSSKRTLVITEGLLVYLTREEVTQLGRDLSAQPSFHDWTIDLCSPGLLKMLRDNLSALEKAGSPL